MIHIIKCGCLASVGKIHEANHLIGNNIINAKNAILHKKPYPKCRLNRFSYFAQ